ncbi:CBS domain-containing protein [Maritalea porphyrae]|uniref:Signal transduction protein n=1 Tax=Maritalea porphyrae TaxID=880732 RepID=A0ABQ5UNM6_9HYPH|nr:CBS domain-containing protein [Maritalea porphyrae]GLQ16435.1 signal transduction protein [Maritalea porphyrae]
MKVSDILHEKGSNVLTVVRSDSVSKAVDILGEHNVGVVVVLGDVGEVCGILSERDIVRRLRESGSSALEGSIGKCMTPDPFTSDLDATVDELMGVMSQKRIRHMPVVDGGKLVGLVSIGDLVKRKIEQAEREAAAMRDYIAS